jgi:hypothetical protein
MSKISDLESDERRNLEEELEAKASGMGMEAYDSYDSTDSNKSFLKDAVGICHNCKNLHFCRSEFAGHDKVFARCNLFEMRLSGQNKITECNCHNARKILSLSEMYTMATLIDPNKPEIKGFISKDKKLKK